MKAFLVVASLLSVAWCACAMLLRTSAFWGREVLRKDQARSFIPELEGLRGVLAFGVFIHHASVTYVFYRTGEWTYPASGLLAQLGPIAVTMFFFLTGYLFWSKARYERTSPTVLRFLRNRLRRLFPTYLVAVATIVIIALANAHFHLLESTARLAAEVGRWVAFGLPFGDLPDINALPRTIFVNANVMWTLRFEWLFYLVLPFVWWAARGRKALWLACVGGVLGGLRLLLGSGTSEGLAGKLHLPGTAVLLTLGTLVSFLYYCAIGFAFGAFTVYLLEWEAFLRWARGKSFPILAAVFFAAGVFLLSPGHGPKLSLLIFPLFLLVASRAPITRPLKSPVVQVLGALSYPLYLLHGIALYLVRAWLAHFFLSGAISDLQYWMLMAPVGLLVILLCALIHRWVESPFMAFGRSAPVERAHQEVASR